MFKYSPLGDSSLIIKLGNSISINIHKQIRALVIEINKSKIDGIVELIPAYNELMLIYEPSKIKYNLLIDELKDIERKLSSIELPNPTIIHIPVCYDFEFAPDLEIVAKTKNLTPKEVINIHSSVEYLVYMLGFTPGFCYLGGLNNNIYTPRKEVPRQIIEAGSVGIAGNQTGIYPIDSPGGWQIIGKTPLALFAPDRKPEFLIEAGNYLKFEAISKIQYDEIKILLEKGKYQIKRERRDG